MIGKTLITTMILFFLYSILIHNLPPNWDTAQNDFQSNIIKAQNYLFGQEEYENIIVGSSLSARLNFTETEDTYNLAIAGGSIFDGLNILLKREALPKRIFIEMNYVERPANIQLGDALNNAEALFFKKHVPVLRENFQPVGILIGMLYSKIDKKTGKHVKAKSIIDKLVQAEIDKNNTNEVTNKLIKNFMTLEELVMHFKSKGCSISFFEMPIRPEVCNLPYPKSVRSLFYEHFPRDSFHFIDQPDCSNIVTSDGKHLTKEEVSMYLKYFNKNR